MFYFRLFMVFLVVHLVGVITLTLASLRLLLPLLSNLLVEDYRAHLGNQQYKYQVA